MQPRNSTLAVVVAFACLAGACAPGSAPPDPSRKTGKGHVVWPDLPTDGFVTGRAATKEDVAANRAVFVLESQGKSIGTPIQIPIPQYAYHIDVDTGKRTPGIIIQAEQAGGQQIVGFQTLPDAGIMAATLQEFEFLGQEKPAQ